MQLSLEQMGKSVGGRDLAAPARSDAARRRGLRAAGRHAGWQDQLDAHHGGAGPAEHRPRDGRWPGRDRRAGARTPGGHGLPAVHQLSLADGGRQHRLAAQACRAGSTVRPSPSACRRWAERLHIAPFLQRLPAELSGGQQQRVAMARALAKGAPLLLLDEPLVNLDYKLREELREELVGLFASGRLHRGLRHHRADGGAAAGRLHGGARCRRAAAVRAHGRGVPPPGLDPRGACVQRSADEPAGGQGGGRWRGPCPVVRSWPCGCPRSQVPP